MSFAEITGQDRAINILKRSIANDHIAHSYLFHGPDGAGKKCVAISFAMAINCTEAKGDACGQCTSCRKISSGIHPDFTLLDGESGEIKISAIRDVINGMVYKPLEAKKRVVIVNGAERFNISSSNAFLKTLEEPPPDTVIILISSSPDMLLQTILSRCRKVSFSQIPPHIIAGMLKDKDVQQIRMEILNGLFTTNRESRTAVFDLSEKFSKDDDSFCNVLYWTLTFLRDIIILKENGDGGLIINKDMGETLAALKDRISLERLLDAISQLKSAYKGQDRNMNRQLALDVLGNKIADSMI